MVRHTRKQSDIGFAAISVVGGLISPDKIAKIASVSPDTKTAESYSCPKGTSLRDEIARYFRIGQAEWQTFSKIETPTFDQCTAFAKSILEEVFGFQDLQGPKTRRSDGHSFRISLEGKSGRVPIVVAPSATGDDLDGFKVAYTAFGDAEGSRAKRRPDALLQEWLNASDPALWGLVFAGDRVRLMRDNASFTRPAFIEADLGAIFRDEMFADFTALWLLIHATRFGNEGAAVTDCPLERWREEGVESGTAARDRLRENVEEALLSLGQGFLEGNPSLREKLDSGALSDQRWFEQLLRVVYRLIFIAVTEERDLLHDPDAKPAVRKFYVEGYSFAQMRERSTRRTLRDPHGDVWEGARVLFRALDKGQPKLGLPALGGIFDEGLTPDLSEARIANKHFLNVIYRLSFVQDEKTRVRINWRDMATEELGSVYEGLLELVPTRTNHGRDFAFAGGDEARGNARKTSGSYYTPDSLVQALLDTALDPVLDKAEANGGVEAILNLTVIDPACGSAHFLLGAARRMAERVAKLRDSENPDFQHALRDVVRRCIYGVDRNPMAVELAKVALWIEAVEPGKPLGFLDANLRCGDSLLGILDLEVLRRGVPDAAYKELPGDEKAVARELALKNSSERDGQATFEFAGGTGSLPPTPSIAETAQRLRSMPEDTPQQVSEKATAFRRMDEDGTLGQWRLAADLYISAFLSPKEGKGTAAQIPTTGDIWKVLTAGSISRTLVDNAVDISSRARAFHWPLEFPDNMQRGGFDCIIGNPPWEVMELSDKEFFASRHPEVAEMNGASRKKAIAKLEEEMPDLFYEFRFAKRQSSALTLFARSSGRFPLTSSGKINSFALFGELMIQLSRMHGRSAFIAPAEILTSETIADFVNHLVENQLIRSAIGFENEEFLFTGIANIVRFTLLTVSKEKDDEFVVANYLKRTSQAKEVERLITLTGEDLRLISPIHGLFPLFRSRLDAALTKKIFLRRNQRLHSNEGRIVNPWGIRARKGFFSLAVEDIYSSEDIDALGAVPCGAGNYRKDDLELVQVYEGKFIWHYDHRFSSYHNLGKKKGRGGRGLPPTGLGEYQDTNFEIQPRYWIDKKKVKEAAAAQGWAYDWLMVWRDITNAKVDRTVTFSVVPLRGVTDTCQILFSDQPPKLLGALLANLNSIVLDYLARQFVGGRHLTLSYVLQLPLFGPSFYTSEKADWIADRVIELTYTSESLNSFAEDLGYVEKPFVWDQDRRCQLIGELDAFFARAYGLTRDEFRYILDPVDAKGNDYPSETFRVLKEKEIREYGEYRTARFAVTAWDQFERDGTFQQLGLAE